jgi:hypothetical protein
MITENEEQNRLGSVANTAQRIRGTPMEFAFTPRTHGDLAGNGILVGA